MVKSHHHERLRSQMGLIDKQIVEVHNEIIKHLIFILNLLKNNRFPEAAGHMVRINDLSDLLEKQTKMYFTQEILDIFETDAKLSYSLEEVESKKNQVLKWLSEVKQKTEHAQNTLRTSRNPMRIYTDLNDLLQRIGCDQRISDFVNTLRILATESEIYNIKQEKQKDRLSSIFTNLDLHPVIKKASRELFEDGHLAEAIFEAYKALISYVKEKSGKKTLDGQNLMGSVFNVKYDRETLQVKKKPLLRLNALSTLEELDEQKGFMHLFVGAVIGIRNPKAHVIIEQKDPFKTLEYLCFASLLAKRVDEAKLNSS